MLLRGSVFFRENQYLSEKPIQSDSHRISLRNGYFELQDQFSFDNRYLLLAVSEENQRDKASVSNFSLTDALSFSYFKALFKEQKSRSLGAGVWFDGTEQVLYLAREAFGLVPLYYVFVPGQAIHFATNIHDLLALQSEGIKFEVDKGTISNFMTFGRDQASLYATATFFKNIKSVPPGHMLAVTERGINVVDRVELRPSKWQTDAHSPAYGEVFRELLTDSVKASMQSNQHLLGSYLSGGLDSSSICVLAHKIDPQRRFETFHYSTRHHDDDVFAAEVARVISSVHHDVVHSQEIINLLTLHTSIFAQPSPKLLSPASQGAVVEAAVNAGCTILMNGSDGDSIVGSGLELIERMFNAGEWQTVQELLKKRVPYFSLSDRYKNWDKLSFEEKYFIVEQNFLYNRISKKLRSEKPKQLIRLVKRIHDHYGISPFYFMKRAFPSVLNRFSGKPRFPDFTILRKDLFEGHQPDPAFKDNSILKLLAEGENSELFSDGIGHVYNTQAMRQNEQTFALANHYNFINCSPFYDKELFEFCLAVPEIVKFGDGRGRGHFREAMAGILPENVRTRAGKGSLGSLGRELTFRIYEQSKELLMDSEHVWQYVDKSRFEAAIQFLSIENLPFEQYNRSTFHVARTISLAVWFEWLRSQKISVS